jgi:hypothetical protein
MEQALQQWRLAHGVEDGAFESLKVVISAYGSSQEHFSAGSFAPNMSQLWQSHAESMLFPASEVNSSTSYVSPILSAGAAPPSNAIVSEPVEDSTWSPVTAQMKNHPITCIKCWAEKKKVYVGDFLRQDTMTNGSLILVRLGNSMQEMRRSNNDSFTPSFVPASPFG